MAGEIFYSVTRDEKKLSILLGSSMQKIDKVSDEATIFLEKYELKKHVFPVSLVLREGLSNAVRHAHKSDSEKVIKFLLKISGNELIMEIEDQGNGFDWKKKLNFSESNVPGPILEQGRGMKIMDQYFSNVSYNDKGNKLILKKRIVD